MTIYQKLQVVKATIGKIPKDSVNPFYKKNYFDINSLLEHLETILGDVGLIVLQPIQDGCVCTEIIDVETEKSITSCMELPKLDDPQKMGSAITYYRRYTLQSLLALQAEDDDGNTASGKVATKVSEWLTEEQFKKASKAPVKQIKAVLALYNGNGKGMKKEYREALEKLVK